MSGAIDPARRVISINIKKINQIQQSPLGNVSTDAEKLESRFFTTLAQAILNTSNKKNDEFISHDRNL